MPRRSSQRSPTPTGTPPGLPHATCQTTHVRQTPRWCALTVGRHGLESSERVVHQRISRSQYVIPTKADQSARQRIGLVQILKAAWPDGDPVYVVVEVDDHKCLIADHIYDAAPRVEVDHAHTVAEHPHIDIDVVGQGSAMRLVFDPSPARRFQILKLLDDDLLRSVLTEHEYEVGSKMRASTNCCDPQPCHSIYDARSSLEAGDCRASRRVRARASTRLLGKLEHVGVMACFPCHPRVDIGAIKSDRLGGRRGGVVGMKSS